MSVFGHVLFMFSLLVSAHALTPAAVHDAPSKLDVSIATSVPQAKQGRVQGGLMRKEKSTPSQNGTVEVSSNGAILAPTAVQLPASDAEHQAHDHEAEVAGLEEEDDEISDTGVDDGTDMSQAGLTAAEAESEEQDRSKANIEKLTAMMRGAHMGNETEERQLLSDLAGKKTGGNVMDEVIDVVDAIPEPLPASILKEGVVPTGDEIVHLERMLLPNISSSQIVDEEAAGIDDAAEDTSNVTGSLEELDLSANRSLLSRRGSAGRAKAWPKSDGKVDIKYCKSTGLSSKAWDEFKKAAKQLNEHCEALDFKESSDCNLKVTGDAEGCWANLGHLSGNRNTVNLNHKGWFNSLFSGTCATKGIAEHEILHALGINHEQTRSDRDKSMKYYSGNVQSGKEHNFKTDASESTSQKYDIGSIMHYGCKAFTTSLFKDTLRANSRRRWAPLRGDCWTMGQRGGLSGEDVKQLQQMYSCSDRRRRRRSKPSTRRRWWR